MAIRWIKMGNVLVAVRLDVWSGSEMLRYESKFWFGTKTSTVAVKEGRWNPIERRA